MIETFQNTVKACLNGNKEHGWGIDDSMKVIEACITKAIGKEPSEELKMAIKEVVNPSQFRQKLETQGLLTKEAKKKRTENLFSKFNS